MECVPPGYMFKPRRIELINYYLKKKIENQPHDQTLPRILEDDVYRDHPRNIIQFAKESTPVEEEDDSMGPGAYFYTTLKNSTRMGTKNKNRFVKNGGNWSQRYTVPVNGENSFGKKTDEVIGYYKYFMFVPAEGTPADEDKWLMHEYSVSENSDMVLCHIVKKDTSGKRNKLSMPNVLGNGKLLNNEMVHPIKNDNNYTRKRARPMNNHNQDHLEPDNGVDNDVDSIIQVSTVTNNEAPDKLVDSMFSSTKGSDTGYGCEIGDLSCGVLNVTYECMSSSYQIPDFHITNDTNQVQTFVDNGGTKWIWPKNGLPMTRISSGRCLYNDLHNSV